MHFAKKLDEEAKKMISGTYQSEFQPLIDEVAVRVAAGDEAGGALHVRQCDEVLVDIWWGAKHGDAAEPDPWNRDTLVNVWSLSKIATAYLVVKASQKGAFALADNVATHWPEFAANEKQKVTISQLLSHSGGITGWQVPVAAAEISDHKTAVASFAEQKLLWNPGKAAGYGAMSYGVALNEILLRTTGLSLKEYAEVEIEQNLGADFRFGLRASESERTATLIKPEGPPPLDEPIPELYMHTFTNPKISARVASENHWREGLVGAANGHATAEAIARICAALPPEMFEPQVSGNDLVLGLPLTWGLGIALTPEGQGYWGGWGGSLAAVDPHRKIAVAYVMNKMGRELLASERSKAYFNTLARLLASRP